jgi:hypothetical protein
MPEGINRVRFQIPMQRFTMKLRGGSEPTMMSKPHSRPGRIKLAERSSC